MIGVKMKFSIKEKICSRFSYMVSHKIGQWSSQGPPASVGVNLFLNPDLIIRSIPGIIEVISGNFGHSFYT